MASKRSKPAECSLLLFAITSSVNSSDVRVSKYFYAGHFSTHQIGYSGSLDLLALFFYLNQKSARNFLQIVEVLRLTVQYSTKVQSCNQFCILD